MKVSTKAYILTGLSYIPAGWAMAQILWNSNFKTCVPGSLDCTGVQCEVIGAPAPVCSLTPLGWLLLALLSLLPLAVLLVWKKVYKH